jgi:hypothetical protein
MPAIEGLEVIYAPTYKIDNRANEDKVRMPWMLRATFSHGEFMRVTAVLLYGGCEEFVLRADTREKLEEAILANVWGTHPRRIRITLTHPDGHDEDLTKR